jgi:hypothetical protein
MRKTGIRTEKSAVAPATIIETLCHFKLPMMASIAERNDKHHRSAFLSGILNVPGPLVSDIGHVALEWSWPMIEQRYYNSKISQRDPN